jgi:hypothetical protein
MYLLQAIVFKGPMQTIANRYGLQIVSLRCGLHMVPLTGDFLRQNDMPELPLTDDGPRNIAIEGRLLDICLEFSSNAKAAYMEAEFFDGAGTQGCALFENNTVVEAAQQNLRAINHALNWPGVLPTKFQDEFEVAGLAKHRETEKWLSR